MLCIVIKLHVRMGVYIFVYYIPHINIYTIL